MEIISTEALMLCMRKAVRVELQEHFKASGSQPSQEEKLLSKQELKAFFSPKTYKSNARLQSNLYKLYQAHINLTSYFRHRGLNLSFLLLD